MTKKELILELQRRGVEKIYGRALSSCLKVELQAYLNRLSEFQVEEHFSISQVRMYRRCGLQYYFRYIEGIKIPPTGIILAGKIFHETAEMNYIYKKNQGKDLEVDYLQDFFTQKFDEEKDNALWEEEKPEEVKDLYVKTIKPFREEILKPTEPELVESEFSLYLNDRQVVGKIDLVDTQKNIRDTKTGKKKKTQEELEKDEQLILYAYAYRTQFGQENEVGYDVAITKKNPETQILRVKIEDWRIQRTLNAIALTIDAILKRVFVPAPDGWWGCHPKYCGYFQLCNKELI